MDQSKVKVAVRVRPILQKEDGQSGIITIYSNSITVSKRKYVFDHVFGEELSEEQFYDRTAAPMLDSFMNGFNCTIFAYGQTGSGKTHTMGTGDIDASDDGSQGLVRTFANDLFKEMNLSTSGNYFQVKATYIEVYGDDVRDLLQATGSARSNPSKVALRVRENKTEVYVEGLQEHIVKDAASIFEILRLGAKNRETAATDANARSSRSHAVFTLHLEQKIQGNKRKRKLSGTSSTSENGEAMQVLRSKFTFVDLAGSERVAQIGAEGRLRSEGIDINQGLSTLGRVINSIAENASHVPYRDSKLTKLLQDALGGNSQTLFLACVSPAEASKEATCSTLQYARQAMKIQNAPVRNLEELGKSQQLPCQMELQSQLQDSNTALQMANQRVQVLESQVEALQDEVAKLKKELQKQVDHQVHLGLEQTEQPIGTADEPFEPNIHQEMALLAQDGQLIDSEATPGTKDGPMEVLEGKGTKQTLHQVHTGLPPEPKEQYNGSKATPVVREEAVAHLDDQELALFAEEEPPEDLEGNSVVSEDQDLGHDFDWDDGAAYDAVDTMHSSPAAATTVDTTTSSAERSSVNCTELTAQQKSAAKVVSYVDAGASSSDDNHHHHDHATHQHNEIESSAVKGKYSGSDSGESEDWNDTPSGEEESNSSGDKDDNVTEDSGESESDAEEGASEAQKKRSNKRNRNGTNGAKKGIKMQNEKKRREYNIHTSSDTKMYWNCDMHARLAEAVKLHGNAWAKVAEHMGGEVTGLQCVGRWNRNLKPLQQGLKKDEGLEFLKSREFCMEGSKEVRDAWFAYLRPGFQNLQPATVSEGISVRSVESADIRLALSLTIERTLPLLPLNKIHMHLKYAGVTIDDGADPKEFVRLKDLAGVTLLTAYYFVEWAEKGCRVVLTEQLLAAFFNTLCTDDAAGRIQMLHTKLVASIASKDLATFVSNYLCFVNRWFRPSHAAERKTNITTAVTFTVKYNDKRHKKWIKAMQPPTVPEDREPECVHHVTDAASHACEEGK